MYETLYDIYVNKVCFWRLPLKCIVLIVRWRADKVGAHEARGDHQLPLRLPRGGRAHGAVRAVPLLAARALPQHPARGRGHHHNQQPVHILCWT